MDHASGAVSERMQRSDRHRHRLPGSERPPGTVDHHLQRIYVKTGVGTRGALALFAIEHGLVRPAPADS